MSKWKPFDNGPIVQQPWFYWPLWVVSWLFFAAMHPIRDNGLTPGKGVVIVPSHRAQVDTFVIGVSARQRLVWIAKRTLWKLPVPGIKYMLEFGGGVPVPQRKEARGEAELAEVELALKTMRWYLRRGQSAVFFGEGGRIKDDPDTIAPIQAGFLSVARREERQIVFAGIYGTHENQWSWGRRTPVYVEYSPPFDPEEVTLELARDVVQTLYDIAKGRYENDE